MANDFTHGLWRGLANSASESLHKVSKQLCEERLKYNNLMDKYNASLAHYIAKEAEVNYLLELLDEAHGGKDKNPARQKAYNEDTKLRIPCGPRKGQIPEKRDHVFYAAMKERFDNPKGGLIGNFKNWFEVIRIHGRFK